MYVWFQQSSKEEGMSKRPMKPMYRTAAEEALILAAIKESKFKGPITTAEEESLSHRLRNTTWAAVRAVVSERKEATK